MKSLLRGDRSVGRQPPVRMLAMQLVGMNVFLVFVIITLVMMMLMQMATETMVKMMARILVKRKLVGLGRLQL